MMIRAYRMRGHLAADLDPLHLEIQPPHPELQPESYGFGPQDGDRPIFIDFVLGLETATVNEILAILKRTYCQLMVAVTVSTFRTAMSGGYSHLAIRSGNVRGLGR